MSVWSCFEGTVRVPKRSRVGFKEVVGYSFTEETNISVEEISDNEDSRLFNVYFAMPYCGSDLIDGKRLKQFFINCSEHGMRCDIHANLRFFT